MNTNKLVIRENSFSISVNSFQSKIMPRRLLQFIFILIALLFAMDAKAGIIIKPVHNFGLVGYWSFQEGAGNNVYDKSGRGNTGTWYGTGSRWADGKIGKGGSFNGSDDYVDLGTTSDLPERAPLTLTAWINGNNISGTVRVIARWDATGTKYAFQMTVNSNVVSCTVRNVGTDDVYYVNVNQVVETNNDKWVFVACVMGNLEMYGYRYGVADSRRVAGSDIGWDASGTGAKTTIGANWTAGAPASYFPGKIDEVRIYNRALSTSEIQRIYKLSQPKMLVPTNTGLVGYWSFEENTGTKVGDMSNNGNHGTMQAGMVQSDWVDGKFGKGLEFDGGSNDYVNTNSLAFNGVSALTVSFWLKPYAFKGEYSTRGEASEVNNGGRTSFGTQGASYNGYSNTFTATIKRDATTNCEATVTKSNYPTRQWYHYVAVYDGTQTGNARLKIYIDGVSKAFAVDDCGGFPATIYDSGATYTVRFGYNGSGTSYYANGILDEIRIYNRALEASEITALYNSGLAKFNSSQNNQITNGLVGLWSFNGSDVDGNEAHDKSGNENKGTITGDTTRVIGKVGQGLSFDGSGDYVDIADSNITDITGAISVAAWIKTRAITGGNREILLKYQDSSAMYSQYMFQLNNQNVRLRISNGTLYPAVITSTNPIQIGNWYHVVGVWDGTTNSGGMKIYINGALNTSAQSTISSIWDPGDGTNYRMFIGGDILGGYQEYFDGIIDEVRLYNRELSAQEVQRLYNLGR